MASARFTKPSNIIRGSFIETKYIDFMDNGLNLFDFPNPIRLIEFKESGSSTRKASSNKRSMPLPYSFKRISYEFENEIRLVLFSEQEAPPFERVPCDLNSLIEDIVVAPQANSSFIEHIKQICSGKPYEKNVTPSTLAPPLFGEEENKLSSLYNERLDKRWS